MRTVLAKSTLFGGALRRLSLGLAVTALAFAGVACDDDDHDDDHDHGDEQEVITTVNLTFTPDGGGTAITASYRDADGDGGDAPVIDDITLEEGVTYNLAVEFLNELEDPAEDITEEVAEEADEHQVFFVGDGVSSEAAGTANDEIVSISYLDSDADGNPLGLEAELEATAAGTGTLRVRLQHLPPLNDEPQKTATLADDVADADGDLSVLPDEADADVEFDIEVE